MLKFVVNLDKTDQQTDIREVFFRAFLIAFLCHFCSHLFNVFATWALLPMLPFTFVLPFSQLYITFFAMLSLILTARMIGANPWWPFAPIEALERVNWTSPLKAAAFGLLLVASATTVIGIVSYALPLGQISYAVSVFTYRIFEVLPLPLQLEEMFLVYGTGASVAGKVLVTFAIVLLLLPLGVMQVQCGLGTQRWATDGLMRAKRNCWRLILVAMILTVFSSLADARATIGRSFAVIDFMKQLSIGFIANVLVAGLIILTTRRVPNTAR